MLAANLIGGILFSGIGFVAFAYGRKQVLPKMVAVGVILMVYPYMVSDTLLLYILGIALTVLLFFLRD